MALGKPSDAVEYSRSRGFDLADLSTNLDGRDYSGSGSSVGDWHCTLPWLTGLLPPEARQGPVFLRINRTP